jgi:hypothetical protein
LDQERLLQKWGQDLMDHLRVWIWTVTECLHPLQEIWDQDQMDQWDHLQEQKVDQWDHLQVKVDHLQVIWRDQWGLLREKRLQ